MEKVNFRIKLQELMTQKKISIAKLARAADLNYGTVFYFLRGKSEITATNLATLFDVLNNVK